MLSIETKHKLKDLFLCCGEEEAAIEKLRQVLCSYRDFEPYTSFKRIDRESTGLISSKQLCQFMRENGYRELTSEDLAFLIRYFDQDNDNKLNYHDYLQVVLPCEDAVLRAAASQRPTYEIPKSSFLPMRVEKQLTQLFIREVKFHLKLENLKRSFESQYDYSIQGAFKCIDDWNFGYIDHKNLRRFLRNMGHISTKDELINIIRRFDLDGDAKINLEEFTEGIKSKIIQTQTTSSAKKPKGIYSLGMGQRNKFFSSARKGSVQVSKYSTPKRQSLNTSAVKSKKKRPQSANKATAAQRKRNERLEQIYKDSTPNKLNKSVTFNNHVKVREFEKPVNQSPPRSIHESPLREPQPRQERANFYLEKSSSPLRNFKQTERVNNLIPQSLNYDNASPLRKSKNGSPPKNEYRSSPLRSDYQSSPTQPLRNFTQPPPLDSSYSSYQPQRHISPLKQEGLLFDRIEQGEVAKVFKDTIFLERELESAKIELTLKPDFNLVDGFKMMDTTNKGYLTSSDLVDSLVNTLGVREVTNDDIYLLLRRYDVKSSGRIHFREYCQIVTPLCKEYSALLNGREDFYSTKHIHPRDYFNAETRDDIVNLWRQVFKIERASECLRVRISRRPNFTIKRVFSYCDKDCDGYLNHLDLRDMLAENGFFATERELNSVMAKFSKIGEQRITFSEFIEELTPKISGL